MTRGPWFWSYLYWGAGWLGLGFLAAELVGETRRTPLRTLSRTVWHAQRTYPPVGPGLFALFVALTFHFYYHRHLVPSLLVGVVVAGGLHLLDRALP